MSGMLNINWNVSWTITLGNKSIKRIENGFFLRESCDLFEENRAENVEKFTVGALHFWRLINAGETVKCDVNASETNCFDLFNKKRKTNTS